MAPRRFPASDPDATSELKVSLEALRAVNANVARALTQSEGDIADEAGTA